MSANPWKTSTNLVDRRNGWGRHRRLVLVLAILLAVGGAAAGYLALRTPAAPDPATLEPEQLVQYMASPAFAEQSDAVKQRYFEAMRFGRAGGEQPRPDQPATAPSGQDANASGRQNRFRRMRAMMGADLTEDQRRQLMENMRPMFEQRMRERMQEFAQLKGEQRAAYLDRIIDRWANRPPRPPRPEGQRDRRGSGDGNDRRSHSGRRGFTPDRLQSMIEHVPADVRAMHMEFRKALRQRMEERGIEPRRPGR